MLNDLRRHADIDDAVFVDPGEADFRFEEGVLDELGVEGVFDDMVRCGETFCSVAFSNFVLAYDIVRLSHDWSTGRERSGGVIDTRQRFYFVINQV